MVLGHNVWSGGMLPAVVTLSGWLMLIKATLLLFLAPQTASGLFLTGLHYQQFFHLYTGIALFLGIYLTYEGSRQLRGR
jgi:amino acid permease